jgi:hypothetical protein
MITNAATSFLRNEFARPSEGNPSISGRRLCGFVDAVLRKCCEPEIAPPVVERAPVYVINVLSWFCAKNYPVHVAATMATGVPSSPAIHRVKFAETTGARMRMPFDSFNKAGIARINESELPPREGDFYDVAVHTARSSISLSIATLTANTSRGRIGKVPFSQRMTVVWWTPSFAAIAACESPCSFLVAEISMTATHICALA